MPAPTLFDRLLALSRFDGDARSALIALHAHFDADFADSSLALLLVRGQGAGRCRLAGLIGPDGSEHVPNLDPNGHRGALPLFDDALAARLIDGALPHVAAIAPTERGLPLAQALFAPACALAVPLANAGELSHWLVFGSTLAHRFDRVDAERILLHVNLATSLIVRPIALRQLTRETERQRHEIESLADIQKLLLPDNPRIRGLDYAVHWQPAATAAGDYYEMSNLSEVDAPEIVATEDADAWGVIVGDVSGHGVAAAAEAMQFDAILRTFQSGDGEPPANVISYANRYFFSRRSRGHFMTVFALLYRPDARVLRFLSAGHPPLLLRRTGDVSLLGEADQIPLGVLRDFAYANNTHDVRRGDIFVLYTDGIVEARDAHGREFGIERLRRLVAETDADTSAQALRDNLVAAVHEHQGGGVGNDDQTLLVLHIAH
ncbi:MAG: serine/threonine-protein phosphatase [Proteobacteria bacterium]|uniref:PP2C family protein-serine/threonine phosphatase n=1 Tax=Rudaea sp. TaxID=2136325 RepID=UPI00321F75B3|nr:serine/threonine-protein phosphatase [Pseudomonadota bacterium]